MEGIHLLVLPLSYSYSPNFLLFSILRHHAAENAKKREAQKMDVKLSQPAAARRWVRPSLASRASLTSIDESSSRVFDADGDA